MAKLLTTAEDSKTSLSDDTSLTNASANVEFNFLVFGEDELPETSKRQYKATIMQEIQNTLRIFTAEVRVMVIAVSLEFPVLKKIRTLLATYLDDQEFQRSVFTIIDELPNHKEQIQEICKAIWQVWTGQQLSATVLYCLQDNRFTVVV